MARKSSPFDELADWHVSDELGLAVENFDKIYAMQSEKLEQVKSFHEEILNNFSNYTGFCTGMRKIGSSYEGVKVVKSEENADFEFDVMFVLKIPEQCHLRIVEIPNRPGYALLNVDNGYKNTSDEHRAANHKFFAGCLTADNGKCIVDAGKTTEAFFGQLQKWMNTKPFPGYELFPRQHGAAIQMDVISEQSRKLFYSVDIVPTLEITEAGTAKIYVVKPEKKRTPDSITWRRLFDSDESDSNQKQTARNILRSAVDELHKQSSESQATCIVESRICKPLPVDYIMRLQEALVGLKSSYRLTLVNLEDISKSTNKRIVAVNCSFQTEELQVLPIPEKLGYAWLKLGEEARISSDFNNAFKLCYLPGGRYLDIKAASDMLVEELRGILSGLFREDTIVRRDGPIIRIDVYPEKGNTVLYYCLDVVLAVCFDDNFYIGLPRDYDDVPDRKAWRRSFSFEETTAIREAPEGLRRVFRVLKALRNGEPGLAQLTSYHLKSLLLKMSKSETMDWNDRPIGKIFIRVLKELGNCLKERILETCYIAEINVLENMTNDCTYHMQKRIEQLLRSKRKMFKALESPKEESTEDLLKEHKQKSAQVFLESCSVPSFSYGSFKAHLMAQIYEQLLGYDHTSLNNKSVYQDVTVFIVSQDEEPHNFDVMMIIHNNKNNLQAVQYNRSVIRLKRCNSTTSSSLLHTVTHSSDLADTKKTAEYISHQIQKLVDQSAMLRENVTLRLDGSNIVLESKAAHSDLRLKILPGYEVRERFFVAMPHVTDTNAWVPITFTPVRNKFWKASQISECGKRVLYELRRIRDRELVMARLGERHLRTAIFWEMEVQRDWTEGKLMERVHDVLERLLTCCKQRNLPDYFCPSRNTLE